MKSKYLQLFRMLRIIFIAIIIFYGLYYLIDQVFNGAFVNWFTDHFISLQYEPYESVDGVVQTSIYTTLNWYELKMFIFGLSITGIIIVTVVIFVISHFYANRKIKEALSNARQMMRDYMGGEKEAKEVFPKEYAEISSQMLEIKSAMQHHEQILRDEANRKNDLIVYLTHDLKTPLTSVIGYLSLLDEATDMPSEQKNKYIGIALDKSHRLEKLINELFEITRYNLQQIELEKESIDLSYMLVQMTDEFYPLLQTHGNTINLDVKEDTFLYGDPIKLARVFNNILKNAIAYSYQDTEIKIWTEKTDTELALYFRNKGRTIPPRKLNAIFEKFFRLDEARTTNTGGAGLGLAIAKEIITLHQGTITAKSENEWTTFCITLPLN
ncbi:MAG: sensor histidine kinase [Beduini sp.]|uniref:sensor histidine kinase n=1 Tax=Beduini sp. TaxID=1922300 RepID=UPI0039A10954